LSVGDYNLTRKNFTNAVTQNKMILVGFSSYSCLKVPPSLLLLLVLLHLSFQSIGQCIKVENEYRKIAEALKPLKVLLSHSLPSSVPLVDSLRKSQC
jgi:hypothetical protein